MPIRIALAFLLLASCTSRPDDPAPRPWRIVFTADLEDALLKGVAVDAEGRVVVVGQILGPENRDVGLWRFEPDGTLQFHARHDGGREDDPRAVAVDAQGRIVVAGASVNRDGNWDLTVWRFTADGVLDPAFHDDGIRTQGGAPDDVGERVIVDAGGRYLIAGRSGDETVVWRMRPDGYFDTGFSGDGMVRVSGGGARGLALDAAGRILACGAGAFWRWTATGSLDLSGTVAGDASAVAADAGGIVLAETLHGAAVLRRLRDDGTEAGLTVLDPGEALDLAIDAPGRAVVCGTLVWRAPERFPDAGGSRLALHGGAIFVIGATRLWKISPGDSPDAGVDSRAARNSP